MDSRRFSPLSLVGAVVVLLAGCEKKAAPSQSNISEPTPGTIPRETVRPKENIDAAEKAEAAKLVAAKCPVVEEIDAFQLKARQLFNNKRFDELESIATN